MRTEMLCLLCLLSAAPLAGEEEYAQLAGAVHIHTTFSTGRESIEEVARHALDKGVDVLVFSDDDLLHVEYGPPFLRRLLSFGRSERSLFGEGTLDEYLAEIRRVGELFPQLVLIDGVESAPAYFWEVDVARGQWVLRNWNKHLLAVGLEEEAYAGLPVIGSESLEVYHWSSLLLLWPLVGLAYAMIARGHPLWLRGLLGAISLLCLVENAPFRVPLWDAYHGDSGAAPYQHYIDYVEARGGLSFWPHPEARSTIEPMSLLDGRLQALSRTPSHADDLLATRGYTGFAALYADNITATEPGGEWDRVLLQYLRGERDQPVWGTGEIDYHYDDSARRNQIHDILTVFLVEERSRRAVLEALRTGRMYAVRGGDERLVLHSFRVDAEQGRALAGQTVHSAGDVEVHVRIDKLGESQEQMRVRLIRSGEVVAQASGMTPMEFKHIDTDVEPGEQRYYRLLAFTRTSRLVSNPIFVRGATE